MCGRYYVDDGAANEIETLLDEINRGISGRGSAREDKRLHHRAASARISGDIRPSNHAVALTKTLAGIDTDIKRWGFRGWDGKGLVINARAETVMEKSMFKESVRYRRCAIPASGFYEWNREKEKFTFFLPENRLMFFAGIYRRSQEEAEDRYVILTTRANASMEPVHPRMPLLIAREDVPVWLAEDGTVERFLAAEPEALRRTAEYQQMSLPFLE